MNRRVLAAFVLGIVANLIASFIWHRIIDKRSE
jgi:hypothetical protein